MKVVTALSDHDMTRSLGTIGRTRLDDMTTRLASDVIRRIVDEPAAATPLDVAAFNSSI